MDSYGAETKRIVRQAMRRPQMSSAQEVFNCLRYELTLPLQQRTEQQRQDYVVAHVALAPAQVRTVRSIAERLDMGRSLRPDVRADEFVLREREAHDFAENGTLVSPHLSDMQTEYWAPGVYIQRAGRIGLAASQLCFSERHEREAVEEAL
jgi:hypothetical protein